MTRRAAFTLLELLLATALASLLMVLILTFSTRVRSAQATLGKEDTGRQFGTQLIALLQRDLALADEIKTANNTLEIVGCSRLDRTTQEPRHGPTRVLYRVLSVGSHGYLVRQQSELDSRSNQESQVEVVLAGVRQFALEPVLSEASAATTQPTSKKPSKLWLTLMWEEQTMPRHELLLVE